MRLCIPAETGGKKVAHAYLRELEMWRRRVVPGETVRRTSGR